MPGGTRLLLLRGLGLAAADCVRDQRHARPDRAVGRSPIWTGRTSNPAVDAGHAAAAHAARRGRAGRRVRRDPRRRHPGPPPVRVVRRRPWSGSSPRPPTTPTSSRSSRPSTGRRATRRIVQSLIRAAERGKQVVVLVEIKARFDEEANIVWARKLERAGAHVVYGLVGLKTHSKTALVVRREGSGLRRYVHIGTGNYNPKTARLYVDLGLLTGPARDRRRRHRPVQRPDRPVAPAHVPAAARRAAQPPFAVPRSSSSARSGMPQAGRAAHIVLKLNAIVDVAVDRGALRGRRRPACEIDLIIRAGCSIQPGIPGVSDNIRVRSIIGEFLEHSRIWSFENGGDREWYIGSADLMDRNLDRRVEAIVPVEDLDARARLAEIIDLMLADDRRSWQLQPDATWVRTETHHRGARARSTRSRCSRNRPSRRVTSRTRRAGPGPAPARWIRARDRGDRAHGTTEGCTSGRGRAQVPRARPGRRRALPDRPDDRAVHGRLAGALDAARGPLRRHAPTGPWRGPGSRSASARRGAASSCRSSRSIAARRAGWLGRPRGAGGAGRPDVRAVGLARIGRPIARAGARRRRPAGRGRDDPPAPPQATVA